MPVMMLLMVTLMMSLVEASAARCSSSCLVQEDIISCRRFDRPSDIRACARRHPHASVLDLSYISIRYPLTKRSLSKLNQIVVLYLDGSRVRRLDVDALAAMTGLQTVSARRMRGSLAPLLDAVAAARSVRMVALADNFVVCSCSWLRAVQLLASIDVVIVDLLDAAPRCSGETVRRCHHSHGHSKGLSVVTFARPPTSSFVQKVIAPFVMLHLVAGIDSLHFFVNLILVPCARLIWPPRQLLSAR